MCWQHVTATLRDGVGVRACRVLCGAAFPGADGFKQWACLVCSPYPLHSQPRSQARAPISFLCVNRPCDQCGV